MFVCLECGEIFEDPQYWEETHGLDHGPYEQWSGCPSCGGAYTKAFKCNCCDEWINDDYFEVDDKRYCKDCCRTVELKEEW